MGDVAVDQERYRIAAPIEHGLMRHVLSYATEYPEDGCQEKIVAIGAREPEGETWTETNRCAVCGALVNARDVSEYHPVEACNLITAMRAWEVRIAFDGIKEVPYALRRELSG